MDEIKLYILRMDEMSGGSMDEIKLLAGIFQNILQNGKNLQPLVSEFITQTGKLETQLRATSKTLSAVLESFNVIAARASNSNSSSPDIGHCLTQVYIHNKAMESYLTAITNGLCNGVNGLLRSRSEEMKRSLGNLEKQHSREFKKLHHNIKRKMELVNKLQKKLKKENAAGSNKEEVDKLSEVLTQTRKSLAAEYRVLEEQVQDSLMVTGC
ncbi:MTSS1-like protein [Eurytemora carolleeae]|uniref:MTSS1-like protein n=1 Tax=Eurytemora carolleeae TaxID=1294199 RepID=UPI000C786C17|nr:MTSS1-like protein [Eurytemora carolleeae]|eukprot:XP_023319563.1 MTSS1-like protein [Eurytemora affinis]